MEENTRPQPRRRWSAARYLIVPALLVAVVVLAVLALQIGARREPGVSQVPAAPTAAPVAIVRTQAPPTAPATAQAEPSPAAPGALTSVDDVQRIDPADAKALVDEGKAVIYDVRTQDSYAARHAAGAILLAYDQVEAQASTLPKDKILILYCT